MYGEILQMNDKIAEIAWGESFEKPIGQAFIDIFYPGAALHKNAKNADLDFRIVDNGKTIAYLEIKKRRIASTDYDSTIVAERKHIRAKKLKTERNISTYVVIAYTDIMLYFDLATEPNKVANVYRKDRGQNMSHAYYCHAIMQELKGTIIDENIN